MGRKPKMPAQVDHKNFDSSHKFYDHIQPSSVMLLVANRELSKS